METYFKNLTPYFVKFISWDTCTWNQNLLIPKVWDNFSSKDICKTYDVNVLLKMKSSKESKR